MYIGQSLIKKIFKQKCLILTFNKDTKLFLELVNLRIKQCYEPRNNI